MNNEESVLTTELAATVVDRRNLNDSLSPINDGIDLLGSSLLQELRTGSTDPFQPPTPTHVPETRSSLMEPNPIFPTYHAITPPQSEKSSRKMHWKTALSADDLWAYLCLPDEVQNKIDNNIDTVAAAPHITFQQLLECVTKLIRAAASGCAKKQPPQAHVQAPVPPPLNDAPKPNDWESLLPTEYVLKLNELSQKKCDWVIKKVNRIAPRLSLDETIAYAKQEIDTEVNKKKGIGDDASVVSEFSTNKATKPTQPPPTIVETVEVKDNLREDTSTDGGLLDVSSLGGTSNGTGQTDLERLCSAIEKSTKLNHEAIIKALENDKIGKQHHNKEMWKQSADDFPAIPATRTEFTIPEWIDNVKLHLSTPPWTIRISDTNVCILDSHLISSDVKATDDYTNRVAHLSKCVVGLLTNAKDLEGVKEALKEEILQHDGIQLLEAVRLYLLPPTALDVVRALDSLGECVQRNGESADAFDARLNNIWTRIQSLGYTTVEQLRLASLQRGIFSGAYGEHKCFNYTLDKFSSKESSLTDWSTRREFLTWVKTLYQDQNIIKDGKMTKISITGRSRQAGTPSPSSQLDESSDLAGLICLDVSKAEDNAAALFKLTDCPLCRLPKNHPNTHNLSVCPIKKKFGYGDIGYRADDDCRKRDYEKRQHRLKKQLKKDREDERRAKDADRKQNKNKDKDEPSPTQDDDDDGFKTIGAGGKDAKSKEEAAKLADKLKQQQKSGSETTENKVRSSVALTLAQRKKAQIEAERDQERLTKWSEKEQGYVDASEADNDINSDDNEYFQTTLNSILGVFDPRDANGVVTGRCVSVARHAIAFHPKSHKRYKIVIDSGATAHMRRFKDDFEIDSYVRCKDTFVVMGDGTEIPVVGYGVSRIKMDGRTSSMLNFFKPEWLKRDQKVTLLHHEEYLHGYLSLSKDNLWEFVTRDKEGQITSTVDLCDIQYSWKMRMQENTFDVGWSFDVARRVFGHSRHVSAQSLKQNFAPPNLKVALSDSNPDKEIWNAAYNEEYDGLQNLDTFTVITTEEYQQYLKKYGEQARAIPSMNLFNIKPDMEGNPLRAKSRIVVLGNLEQRIWSKEDKYAPVLSGSAARLLLSMAVEDGRRLKQGDCKNAFCNSILPDDEICIIRPPIGCPRSQRGTFWKLNKTLYGLTRSPHHWFTKISNHLTKDMGFEAIDQDKCVFKCKPFPDKPPIYLGLYVDDFIYYSKSDEVEEWFERNLKSHITVDFMGDVQWFLGQRYDWTTCDDGSLSCHVSQQAFVEGMLQKFNLQHIATVDTPYRSGLKIDRIEQAPIDESRREEFSRNYQSMLGCFNWLTINTRPDINTAYSLLSQFNSKPSIGHWDAAKHVLKYLKGTASHGIWFKQHGNRLQGHVAIPEELRGDELLLFTDSNWGPQDASRPKENETRKVSMHELKSIQGFYLTRMGGPLLWGVQREKRGSRSSCMAEIKALDEGIKGIQYLRHLMQQIGLPDIKYPTPVLNDNKGAIDWIDSGCKPSKKLRHENLAELGIYEAKQHNEVEFYWIPGKTNPADIFTKEDNDRKHYQTIRDHMVKSREDFNEPQQRRWGVLINSSTNCDSDEAEIDLTQLTKNPLTSLTKIYEVPDPVAVSAE